jgi:3-methyladenine DNA glycosylase AlkD
MEEITKKLFSLQDEKYRDFQIKLVPGITKEQMIGIRTPDLRALEGELRNPLRPYVIERDA